MQNRTPKYPGRVKLVPVDAANGIYDMIRADEPTQPGDPLNKNTFLKDETAALFGLDGTAVPDDVFEYLGLGAQGIDIQTCVEYITESKTWVAPEDLIGPVLALVFGAGGGGGAGYSKKMTGISGNPWYGNGGGGGGSGHLKIGTLNIAPSTQIDAIIGAGGAGGTVGGANGSDGGRSSFDELIADGGSGGVTASDTARPDGGSGGSGGGGGSCYATESLQGRGGDGSYGGGGGGGFVNSSAGNGIGGNGGVWGGAGLDGTTSGAKAGIPLFGLPSAYKLLFGFVGIPEDISSVTNETIRSGYGSSGGASGGGGGFCGADGDHGGGGFGPNGKGGSGRGLTTYDGTPDVRTGRGGGGGGGWGAGGAGGSVSSYIGKAGGIAAGGGGGCVSDGSNGTVRAGAGGAGGNGIVILIYNRRAGL